MAVVLLNEAANVGSTDPAPPLSVLDAQMGPPCTNVYSAPCGRCGKTLDCPGHPGAIQLPCPIYHSSFIGYVVNILSCVCFSCSSLLLQPGLSPAMETIE